MYSAHGHPTPETLEEYAFQRLSEADTEVLEEHLLACANCQTALAEIDEYILLMKVATAHPSDARAAEVRAAPVHQAARHWFANWDYTVAGMALIVAVAVAITQWPATVAAGPPQTVRLEAVRGGDIAMNHAAAHRPVDLAIDVTGLSRPASEYRVSIVTPAGAVTWSGTLKNGPTGSTQPVHLARGLPAGVYWVRLYGRDELLREFGLKAD